MCKATAVRSDDSSRRLVAAILRHDNRKPVFIRAVTAIKSFKNKHNNNVAMKKGKNAKDPN